MNQLELWGYLNMILCLPLKEQGLVSQKHLQHKFVVQCLKLHFTALRLQTLIDKTAL